MRSTSIVIVLVATLASASAFADDPVPTAAAPATATPAAAPAAAPATTTTAAASGPADAAATQAAVKAEALEEQNKRMRGLGYKPEPQRDGTMLYCRREEVLGTHFDKKVCATAESLARTAEDAKMNLDHMRRISTSVQKSN